MVGLRRDTLNPFTQEIRMTAAPAARPVLVFIHGFLDGAAVWNDVVAALDERASGALCIDLPGMGARAGEPGPDSLDAFADDVAKRVRALGGPVVLVGQSMGAQVAELAAHRLGAQVRALVLLTPVPLQGTGLPAEVMQTFHALGGNPVAQRALRRQLGPGLTDAQIENLGRLGDAVDVSAVGAFADLWNRGHALGTRTTRFAGPVLLVRGEVDAFVTDEMFSGAVVSRFEQPAIASVAEAGHWPHAERPQAFATVLRDFLRALEPAAGADAAPQGWTRAFEQKSAAAFADAFAADIVLEASTLTGPVVGAEQVMTVMATASTIYEALAFTQRATEGQRTYLEWEAQAFGGEKLSGITILTRNEDGKIVRAAIHHRPLGGALKFSAELGRRLQGKVDASRFYSAS
jgi:pimeloyl-ACP methyl ester carboxylesterase